MLLNKYFVLLFALVICSCGSNTARTSLFVVQKDTINLNADSLLDYSPVSLQLSNVCRYNDLYLLNSSEALFSISKNLKIDTIPYSKYDRGCELFVDNDTLKILSYQSKNSNSVFYYYEYYNPENQRWYATADTIRQPLLDFGLTYEDDTYRVKYSGRGEFGDYLLFDEKTTCIEYLFFDSLNKLLSINGRYIVIGNDRVCEIDNPRKGVVHEGNLNHEFCFFNPLPPTFSNDKLPKSNLLYKTEHNTILSGFSINNDIYLVVNDSIETFIGQLDNGKLNRIVGLGEKIMKIDNSHFKQGRNISNQSLCLCGYDEFKRCCYILDVEGLKNKIDYAHILNFEGL